MIPADETPLDRACRAAAAAPEDDALRLAVHGRLLEAELFLLLEADSPDDRLRPLVFPLDTGPVVLAFDRDDRLAAFLDAPAPYAALAARRLVALLAGQGLGLGVNLGVAPSELLLPAEAVDWLADMAARRPDAQAAPRRGFVAPPPEPALEAALQARLAGLADLVPEAHLVATRGEGDAPLLLLALVGTPEAAERVLAAAIAEAVRFTDRTAPLDLVFLTAETADHAAVARVSRPLQLPAAAASPAGPSPTPEPAPNPDRPPILRWTRTP